MPDLSPSPEQNSHQEIAELERLLEAKKRELAGTPKESAPEREAFRETFREKYAETLAPSASPPSSSPSVPTPAPASGSVPAPIAAAGAPEERERQIESLVEIAFTKGIPAAAEIARQTSPWLMDALHDRLQDRYWERLIQLRQLKAL